MASGAGSGAAGVGWAVFSAAAGVGMRSLAFMPNAMVWACGRLRRATGAAGAVAGALAGLV